MSATPMIEKRAMVNVTLMNGTTVRSNAVRYSDPFEYGVSFCVEGDDGVLAYIRWDTILRVEVWPLEVVA